MASCVGCGLFDPDDGVNPVRVNTSGTWGGAGLAFPNGDTQGAPIYCASNGMIRTVPEHTSEPLTDSFTASPGAGFAGTAVNGSTRAVTVTNPSSERTCSYLFAYFCKIAVSITVSGIAFRVNVTVNGGAPSTRTAEFWGVPGVYAVEQILSDTISGTLLPGASGVYGITPGIDATSPGTGAGTLVSNVIRVDAIFVTRAT